jgi:hypothetical protein
VRLCGLQRGRVALAAHARERRLRIDQGGLHAVELTLLRRAHLGLGACIGDRLDVTIALGAQLRDVTSGRAQPRREDRDEDRQREDADQEKDRNDGLAG